MKNFRKSFNFVKNKLSTVAHSTYSATKTVAHTAYNATQTVVNKTVNYLLYKNLFFMDFI